MTCSHPSNAVQLQYFDERRRMNFGYCIECDKEVACDDASGWHVCFQLDIAIKPATLCGFIKIKRRELYRSLFREEPEEIVPRIHAAKAP